MQIFKTLVVVLVLTSFNSAWSQQAVEVKKNVVSYEFGIWSRGLAGITYTRNFGLKEGGFLSGAGGYGVGKGFQGTNHYVTANFSANFGKRNVFFCLGLEGKYFSISEDFFHSLNDQYPLEGVTVSPAIGIKILGKNNNLLTEFRLSSIPLFVDSQLEAAYPSVGVSVGLNF